MRNTMKKLANKLVWGMLVAIVAPPWPLAADMVKGVPPGKQWHMKYSDGTEELEEGAKIKVKVDEEHIICTTQNGRGFSIPVAEVSEVSYEAVTQPRARQLYGIDEPPIVMCGDIGCVPDLIAIISRGLEYREHFVRIVWPKDANENREAVFRVSKRDYRAFLAELHTVTGKPWKDRSGEREKLWEKQEQNKYKLASTEPEDPAREAERIRHFQQCWMDPCQCSPNAKGELLKPSSTLTFGGLQLSTLCQARARLISSEGGADIHKTAAVTSIKTETQALPAINEWQLGPIDLSCGLKGVAGPFCGHMTLGQPAQPFPVQGR